MRTHTITIGDEAIDMAVPLTARQRTRICGEWWSAAEALDAAVKAGLQGMTQSELASMEEAVHGWIGAALVRMAPESHRWREWTRRYRDEGHAEPVYAAGLDVVDAAAEIGISPSALSGLVQDVCNAAYASPTLAQVEAAQGNSEATPS